MPFFVKRKQLINKTFDPLLKLFTFLLIKLKDLKCTNQIVQISHGEQRKLYIKYKIVKINEKIKTVVMFFLYFLFWKKIFKAMLILRLLQRSTNDSTVIY